MPTKTTKTAHRKPVVKASPVVKATATRSRASHPKAKQFDDAMVTAAIRQKATKLGLEDTYADAATKDWIETQGLNTVAAILGMEGSDQSLVTEESKATFQQIAYDHGCEQFLDQLFGRVENAA